MGLNDVYHLCSSTMMIRARRTQKLLLVFVVFLCLLVFAQFSTRLHLRYSFSQDGEISTSMGLPTFSDSSNVHPDQVGETVDQFEHDVNPDDNGEEEDEDDNQEHSEEPESPVIEVVSTTEEAAGSTPTLEEVIKEPVSIMQLFGNISLTPNRLQLPSQSFLS